MTGAVLILWRRSKIMAYRGFSAPPGHPRLAVILKPVFYRLKDLAALGKVLMAQASPLCHQVKYFMLWWHLTRMSLFNGFPAPGQATRATGVTNPSTQDFWIQ